MQPSSTLSSLLVPLLAASAAVVSCTRNGGAAPVAQETAPYFGEWASSCQFDAQAKQGYVHVRKLGADGNFVDQYLLTKDEFCERSHMTFSFSGTFRIGRPAAEGSSALTLDIHVTDERWTPTDEVLVTMLNDKRECGLSNWAFGVPVDVRRAPQPCSDSLLPVRRQRAELIELGEDVAYFGSAPLVGNLRQTEAMRPTTVDTSKKYIRL